MEKTYKTIAQSLITLQNKKPEKYSSYLTFIKIIILLYFCKIKLKCMCMNELNLKLPVQLSHTYICRHGGAKQVGALGQKYPLSPPSQWA